MQNVVSLLPHAKKDSKVESKQSKGGQLNELVELRGCSSCLFFEVLHMCSVRCRAPLA
jgi:ribosome biogenesis protein BRX1